MTIEAPCGGKVPLPLAVNEMLYGDNAIDTREFGLGRLLTDEEYAAVTAPEPEPPAVIGDPMYGTLAGVLQAAHDHAARGKGHDRHGSDDVPFLEQPTMQIARLVGVGYPAGQIMKKADEAKRMVDRGEYDAAVLEFFGVINYAAAAILAIREM